MASNSYSGLYRAVLRLFALLAGTFITGRDAQSQTTVNDAIVTRRLQDVVRFIGDSSGDIDGTFTPEFVRRVTRAQLLSIFANLHAEHGAVVRVAGPGEDAAAGGSHSFVFGDGVVTSVKMVLEDREPFRISSLLLGAPVRPETTLPALAATLAKFNGTASLYIAPVDGDRLTSLAEYQAQRPLAIASTFKLHVLDVLTRAIRQHEHQWSEVVTLREEDFSLPSGVLHTWPVGTPLTLQTAASLMMSISDNTATDLLIRVLGRARVEAAIVAGEPEAGNANTPLLATSEYFRLLVADSGRTAGRVANSPQDRRALLPELRRQPLPDPALPLATAQAKVGWFGTAAGLAQELHRLRLDGGADSEENVALQILGITRGLATDRAQWPYGGAKGGDVAGVFSYATLLESHSGRWYTVAFVWNGDPSVVTPPRAMPFVQRAMELLANEPHAP
ncbi:MAG: serine hydrolase [bacterium]